MVVISRQPPSSRNWPGRLALGLLVASVLLSGPAHAWRQAHTDTGLAKTWRQPLPLPVLVAPGEQKQQLQAAIDRAVALWTAPACTGLRFAPRGRRVTITPVWTWPAQRRAAAWTDVVGLSGSGEIIAAHIELDARLLFGMREPPDLDTVVLHEIGHVLGLAHPGRGDVLMSRGVIMAGHGAHLSADERAAVCALYPVGVFDRVPDPGEAAQLAEGSPVGSALLWTGRLALALLAGLLGLALGRSVGRPGA